MPLRALLISTEIAKPITPTTTSRAPTKLGRGPDQDARRDHAAMLGRMPKRKTAPPIAMLPVTCCAPARFEQARRALQRLERAGALDRDHRRREEGDQRPADCRAGGRRSCPTMPPWFSSALRTTPTTVETAAQPAICEKRLRATASPSPTVACSAVEDHVGGGREADAEVDADRRQQVEADHRQRPADRDLAVVDQVEARADHDHGADDRRRRAVEREADQLAVLAQHAPAFLRQAPSRV